MGSPEFFGFPGLSDVADRLGGATVHRLPHHEPRTVRTLLLCPSFMNHLELLELIDLWGIVYLGSN